MNFWRDKFGGKIPGRGQAAGAANGGDGETPGPDKLFVRANEFRSRNGLADTDDSSVAAQIVLTSIAMDVLGVGDRKVHPDVMDTAGAALAWAYVCCMSVPIIAIADKRDDFDHQAFVLAVASAVFQFFDNQVLVQIIQQGTGLFQSIVAEGEKSQAFLDFNDRVHGLVLACVRGDEGDAIGDLRERYSAFGKLIA
jgi:hypothetical protein